MSSVFYYALLICPLLSIVFAILFRNMQNQGKVSGEVGGNISMAKALWLFYCIISWFVLPIFYYTSSRIHSGIANIYCWHLISWWLRGPIELLMIYKFYNWSPRYGIAHNLLHFGMLNYFFWRLESSWIQSLEDALAIFYLLALIVGILFETWFAWQFLKIRGEDKSTIYFADTSKQWKTVNRVTWLAVLILYSHLVIQAFVLLY